MNLIDFKQLLQTVAVSWSEGEAREAAKRGLTSHEEEQIGSGKNTFEMRGRYHGFVAVKIEYRWIGKPLQVTAHFEAGNEIDASSAASNRTKES